MMYVGYPALTRAERLAALPPLLAPVKVNAEQAWRRTGGLGMPEALRLNSVVGRPVFHFLSDGHWHSIGADDGQRLQVDDKLALRSACAMAAQAALECRGDSQIIEFDQWSIGSSLDPYRPLYRVSLDDAAGHIYYVSAQTGEVVRDTDRSERAWNWAGSVIHWIYFAPLRVMREPWRQVVMWASGAALLTVALGSILGIQRLRLRRRYGGNRVTPYRGWKRWHHLLGLGLTIFALSWLFSGWLSVNPFNWFDHNSQLPAYRAALAQGSIDLSDLKQPVPALLDGKVVELEWLRFLGQGYVRVSHADGSTALRTQAHALSIPSFSGDALHTAAQAIRPQSGITQGVFLDEGDFYYYRHNTDTAVDERPLPIFRADFSDGESLYLDPASGRLIEYANNDSRLYRWLFYALHRLDFPWLTQRRPLWDLLMIGLCLFGCVASLSGVVLGWRRLKRNAD